MPPAEQMPGVVSSNGPLRRSSRLPARDRDESSCFHNYKGLGLQFAALGSIVYREACERKMGLSIDDVYFTQSVHP